MPRPNRGTPEKSKDFMGSMKKLLKNYHKIQKKGEYKCNYF